jgi:outer membrane protein assembly factor BamE (lipoprotein component of BamABCDE complex)
VARAALVAGLAAIALAACSEQVIVHGHQFRENDVMQIQPGMGQEQVRMALGSPTTTSATGGTNAYYYISSTTTQNSFMKPSEKDRQVVAVYFTPTGTVERVANYGLKDGKVFDFVSRTTPAPGARDEGLLKQLFRNLGTKQLYGE